MLSCWIAIVICGPAPSRGAAGGDERSIRAYEAGQHRAQICRLAEGRWVPEPRRGRRGDALAERVALGVPQRRGLRKNPLERLLVRGAGRGGEGGEPGLRRDPP